jgi:hypothetical protein
MGQLVIPPPDRQAHKIPPPLPNKPGGFPAEPALFIALIAALLVWIFTR